MVVTARLSGCPHAGHSGEHRENVYGPHERMSSASKGPSVANVESGWTPPNSQSFEPSGPTLSGWELRPHYLRLHIARLDTIDRGIRLLAEELDPLFLEPRIVLGRLDQIEEATDRVVEALLQQIVLQPSVFRERLERQRQ